MLRLAVVLLLLPLVAPAGATAASDAVWTQATPGLQRGPLPVAPDPSQSATFTLRGRALRPRLDAAPRERSRAAGRPLPTVSIPLPDGTLQRFRIAESPVMEPGLAAKVPSFTSYAAIGIDDPTATARLDFSSLGFHATVRSASASWFVDPSGGLDSDRHIAYRGTEREIIGGSEEPITTSGIVSPPELAGRPAPGGLVARREYGLALASDPSYAQAFPGPTGVADAKAALVNRADQLYGDDLAIRLMLVDGNDQLNFSSNAAFELAGYPSAQCNTTTLQANQLAIDSRIGSANYDVGHLVSAGQGGGLSGLGVVGQASAKAFGCSGVPDPRGDGFAIDYFSHELGHEFGANHTFDGTDGKCGGVNRNGPTSVEPGSGSSVMAYAGICGADDLQSNSDPYFSQRSITEIQAYVSAQIPGAANGGSAVVTTGNHAPVVSAPGARTIPDRTPFTLTGSGSDPDGDPLVYLWEQNDSGPGEGTSLMSNAKPSGALFRQFGTAAVESAALSPAPGRNVAAPETQSRTFPDLAQILSGNTNAATGSCPEGAGAVECFSEFLPTSARTMNFRLTARDRVLTGGGESSDDVPIAVAGSGPFLVSSQAVPGSATGLSAVPVTWEVAGTDAAPVSTAAVRILYSTDGGLSFPTVLAARTPNDGARTVTVPDVATTKGRVKVEAVDNYFFDVSRGDLAVTSTGGVPPADPDPDAGAPPVTTPPRPDTGPGRLPPIIVPPTLTGEAAKDPAKIRVLRAGVAAKRLDVLAEITKRASGSVRVSYRSGGKTTHFSARIAGGRIRFKHRLRGAGARKATGIFTLSYAGDEDVRTDMVRLRAASRRAGLRRKVVQIRAGVLEVSGTISKRARGVVRIRMEYLAGSKLVLRGYRAKIDDGRWRLSTPLPAAAAVAGGQLAIQYTGYERARMRGEQSGKRVPPG